MHSFYDADAVTKFADSTAVALQGDQTILSVYRSKRFRVGSQILARSGGGPDYQNEPATTRRTPPTNHVRQIPGARRTA